ncbi:PEP-CTERM protein-sorting domain-containing protein [Nitrosospira multiformis]|uniref:PEP-CTERM protein-sorting domain-containing protein n=1 Tax=Nitrosospira multiformis TaxID=1231 RepID=A0A1H8DKF3_9PROT|nr:flocculation-associated PEP-CTERM protein PepA [Nitrosospira multiformis]SEN07028.1 PEP-CTERM protein-sorting domain-containing protein [Nitrosospira multiformis]
MKKTILAAAVAGVFAATTAQAGPLTNVNVFDGSGGAIATNVSAFDWNEAGSGLAIGKGPLGSDPTAAPNPFTLVYQANLVSFTGDNTPATGLNNPFATGGYEFTIASRFDESATTIGPNTAQFTPIPGSGTVSIFFDNAAQGGTQADVAAGTGFTDGLEIARFLITGGTSTFTLIDPTTGLGSTNFHFDVTSAPEFVNASFIQGVLGDVMDLHFVSNQNAPTGTSTTISFHGGGLYPLVPVTGADLLLKVDGASQFSTIPEPGSLALVAIGLLGLGLAGVRGAGSRNGKSMVSFA